ncbi:AAA family ATPase [Brasilonema sp. CT11]|nr:AAA family ATPase [Brasilonema sp. CT11]
MLAKKKDEFARLFQEFLNSYPYTSVGLRHTAAYEEQRQLGKRNFEAIASAAHFGEDVIELVLLQLLPYPDTTKNRQRGAWIHISSSVSKDIKECFETMWIKPEDWQYIALELLNFVRRCNDDPKLLSGTCVNFSQLPYAQYLQTGTITPILNALQPEKFLLMNSKSIRVINYFANTAYTEKLTDYPKLNLTGKNLIAEFSQQMHQSGVPALRDDDLFDMFSHWLVAVKKYNLTGKDNPRFQEVELQPEYTLAECAEKIGFNEAELERWIRGIHRKGQAILYGSPGTGKTFIAEKLAQHLIGGGNGFSELVQFHPAYSYEDFIQGIRPQNEDGKLTYLLVPGRFVQFCKEVENCQGICVLIIDEINRANLAQVFGELMYLLEYRDKEIPLAGGNRFRIPANVRIIGTMNTADRSIALVDYALRRRFAFIELRPNYDLLRRYHRKTGFAVEVLIKILNYINLAISDKNYEIGISFFLTDKLSEHIEDIWRMEIEPYLEEYFFNQRELVNEFRWEKVKQQLSL